MAKIKERNRKKAALNDRKSAASQARMKNIASLAADDGGSGAKKRRKGAGGTCRFRRCIGAFTDDGGCRRHVRGGRCGLGDISQDRAFTYSPFSLL